MKKTFIRTSSFFLWLVLFYYDEAYPQHADSILWSLQPVVVTANRFPVSEMYVSRSLEIIDVFHAHHTGMTSVTDLLQQGLPLDVQQRGPFGIQTDISIRGSQFDQHLLLLDGVRLNDPQTSHHNYDLPLSTSQIQRIEILQGPGSAFYGPDALGGVVNIITHIPDERTLHLDVCGGEYGLSGAAGDYTFSASGLHSSTSVEYRRSDGYREDTDFRAATISSNNTLDLPFGTCSLFAGYTSKEFGAFHFYGPSPSKEWTETTFFHATTSWVLPAVMFQPTFSYRRHHDKFMYDIRTPDLSVNNHTTNAYNGELQSIIQADDATSLLAGISGNWDNITSTNLRTHDQSSLGMMTAVHSVFQKEIILDLAVREDVHSRYGQQFNPSINAGYLLSQSEKIFLSAGRSFRAPSYTELYYTSPTRIGNAALAPETGWSYEVGAEYRWLSALRITMSLFERDQKNLIDYVKFSSTDSAYRATNFTSARTRGAETTVRWTAASGNNGTSNNDGLLSSLLVSYVYLDSRIDVGPAVQSLYSFTHPRHQVSAACSGTFPYAVHWTASATHKIKLDGTHFTVVNASLSHQYSVADVSLHGSNLLNQSYEEIADVPLPGRWLWVEVECQIL